MHPWRVEGRRKRCIEPADDRFGRILWEEQAEPGADIEIRQALFPSARQAQDLGERLGCRMAIPLTELASIRGLPVGLSVQM